jgi:hypothetical protein
MANFDVIGEHLIPRRDMQMIAQTLEVWCGQHKIPRSQAISEAKLLLDTYRSGKCSQIELIDALVQSKHSYVHLQALWS